MAAKDLPIGFFKVASGKQYPLPTLMVPTEEETNKVWTYDDYHFPNGIKARVVHDPHDRPAYQYTLTVLEGVEGMPRNTSGLWNSAEAIQALLTKYHQWENPK